MNSIEVEHMTKRFRDFTALDNISFQVKEKSVVGLLGPNGAGKTTLLRILSTLMKPNSGYARINSLDARYHARKIRKIIGFMPDFLGSYKNMKVMEFMLFFAHAYKIQVNNVEAHIGRILDVVGLGDRKNYFIEHLSRGMRQKLGLARTLIHDPSVLFLDEPASGLDPRARTEICRVIADLHNIGKTIIFSSHILPEIEQVCNEIILINNGRIVFQGAMEAIREKYNAETTSQALLQDFFMELTENAE